METIAAQLGKVFREAIREAFGVEAEPLIALSQNEKFGDYQSNVAMGLAKQVSEKTGQKANPRQVAEAIKGKLKLGEMADEKDVSIAGPGFINVRLRPEWLAGELKQAAESERLGIDAVGEAKTVVVDYSGPNIAKELHVGHLRSTIIGDAVSRVIEFEGHHVIRQNHIGDWGTQFGMLIAYGERVGLWYMDRLPKLRPYGSPSVPQEENQSAMIGGFRKPIGDLEAFYREAKAVFDTDPAFQEEARRKVVALQRGSTSEKLLWEHIVQETRRHYQPLYERLGVKLTQADEKGESFYNSMLADVVRELRDKGMATASEGAVVAFTEGHESPLIIEKSGGGFLYGTTDLAAVRYRVKELHANRIVYFVDARQSQHFEQVFATARKAGWAESVSLEHAPFGTMLGPDGRPFRTKAGGTVKLKELLDEAEKRAYELVTEKNPELPAEQRRTIARAVGIGAIKYSDLSKDRISDYVFSWERMLSLEGNTAPYLQYAYARIRSIFRKAEASGFRSQDSVRLESPFELALAKHILRLGEIVDLVARELKPHHLCNYLYELATKFSGFYENCPVIQSEEPVRSSRLALCDLTARTMARGLDLLGIEHPEQM